MIRDTNAVFKQPTCVQSAQTNIVYFWDIDCKFDLKG